MNIGNFSVKNPVLVNIIMLVIILLGISSALRLSKEDFPEIPFYFIFITVPYPGVAADDIERSVTIKIEDEMQNLEFLDEMSSDTVDGLAFVQLEFRDNITSAEFENVLQEVRGRFGNLALPDDVGQEIIDDFSSTDFFPVIQVIVSGDVEYEALLAHAERLSRSIKRINGVNDITIIGERELEILVEVDREQSDAYGVSLSAVSNAIRSTNLTVPGGTLRGSAQSFLLRTDESIENIAEISDIMVSNGRGSRVRVGDIAFIDEVYDRDGVIFRYNGQPALSLSVSKLANSDSVDIVNSIRQTVSDYEELLSTSGSEVQFNFFGDTSVEVVRNIGVLGRNIAIGFVFVVLVLYFFLGLRNAFLAALGIPITFAATFFILDLLSFTLNSNVLFALVLVLGLIVDHAIVIIENAYSYNLAGKSRHEAAITGVNRVMVPVIAATATTVAAFLPLAFLPGVIGRFLRVVPVAACVALTVSTAEALFILPSHYADWGKKNAVVRSERRFSVFRSKFKALLAFIYKHRLITVIIFIVLIVVSIMLFGSVGQDLFVFDEVSLFYIDIELASGSSLEKTGAVVDQFEKRLLPMLERDDVVSLSSSVGFQSANDGNVSSTNVGQITIDLLDLQAGRETEFDSIIADARVLVSDVVGTERVRFRKVEGGPPTESPVVYRLYGDNFDELETVSEAIQERLTDFPQLVDIRDNFTEGSPELRLVIDNDNASRYGLSVQQVGVFLRNAIEGIESGDVFIDGQERGIVVLYQEGALVRPEQLLLLRVPNTTGQFVPLSSIARIETGKSPGTIRRLDQRREITVQANATNTENLFVIDNAVQQYFNDIWQPQYPDVELVTGGQFAEFATLLSDILLVLGVGVFLIYVILGAQFRSYIQPVLIILTIPFAFLGVILYLIISGTSVSTIVIYAAVALAGIAVNDSIVLISFINELRTEGKSVYESVMTATAGRLRPILLTSLTTIGGLVPAALGLGGRSIVWVPMANTIIFGLIFSTVTTLIIVPCLYGLFLDKEKKQRRKKRKADKKKKLVAEAT